MKTTYFSLVLCAAWLSGCASPQPALDQANHGAALTAALHDELRAYRTLQATAASSRLETIKELERRISEYDRSTNFNDRIAKAAGKTEASSLYQTITELADSKAADEAAQTRRLADLKERLDALLTPLPDSATRLAAVQKAMAVLGSELSAGERIRLITGFASDLKSQIDKSKEAAEKGAKKGPVQPAPPGSSN
jgi:hypothetical protein